MANMEITILFSCVGRRVELIQAFRAAGQRLGVSVRVVGTDSDSTAPALSGVDVPILVPPISDGRYIASLVEAAKIHNARTLIPTIDTDLPLLSRHREDFRAVGCEPLIAAPDVIDICRDKIQTYRFLEQNGIDCPVTYTPEEILKSKKRPYPLFLKPRFGSASQSIHKIDDDEELRFFLNRTKDPIVQEYVQGVEYTLDVYVGLSGAVRCVVPRARWQVRTGEVSKGVVIKDRKIMEAGKRVVEALTPPPLGLVTLQCIVTTDHRIRFIEINPRFGGGAPMGIAAGADYPGWLIQELLGQNPEIQFDGFQHGLCMLRYDWSAFLPLGQDLTPRVLPPLKPFPNW